eukprot:CAMPEP_0197029626 /NCGR_PEP_ID=MMETSP1384-20130603/9032_1 /TAXON_ID=29189 /ORGANISM="Ammonia sp." /LENGTH=315 /DNA_ID=CAMNT_0042458831 /DNA_START=197 /DNA_END=1144 /DNA_ORIENTATION=+
MSLLRFISSSIMFNGIFSFLNHWHGRREWLFMDNVSVTVAVILLLKLAIDVFVENYDYVIIHSATPRLISKKYGRAASISITAASSMADRERSISTSQVQEIAVKNVKNQFDFITRPIPIIMGWILALLAVFFLVLSYIQGCAWQQIQNQNLLFIVFILVLPIVVLLCMVLFYYRAKSNNHQIGTIVHSADMAHFAFKVFLRGVITILIGNLLWIITEEACKGGDHALKAFPGLLFYHLLTFYGYLMVIMYVIFLSNDLQRKVCYFESAKERGCGMLCVVCNTLLPSIKRSNSRDSNAAGMPRNDEETEQKESVR